MLAAGQSGSPLGALVPILLIGACFYLLAIRPQRARLRRAQEVQSSLASGQEVMTTSGLYGTVTELGDDTVTLEIAPGVAARFARGAVAQVVSPSEPETLAS
ncbi:MAG: preprotein translocase subunit YajC [Mycobacteriales bacterium]|nr:preprotein translocase subunit YajC [Frankia sp.]